MVQDELAATERRLTDGEARLARLEALTIQVAPRGPADGQAHAEAVLARFRTQVAETRRRVAALRGERESLPA